MAFSFRNIDTNNVEVAMLLAGDDEYALIDSGSRGKNKRSLLKITKKVDGEYYTRRGKLIGARIVEIKHDGQEPQYVVAFKLY